MCLAKLCVRLPKRDLLRSLQICDPLYIGIPDRRVLVENGQRDDTPGRRSGFFRTRLMSLKVEKQEHYTFPVGYFCPPLLFQEVKQHQIPTSVPLRSAILNCQSLVPSANPPFSQSPNQWNFFSISPFLEVCWPFPTKARQVLFCLTGNKIKKK